MTVKEILQVTVKCDQSGWRIVANLVTQMQALASQPANELSAVSVKLPQSLLQKMPLPFFALFCVGVTNVEMQHTLSA